MADIHAGLRRRHWLAAVGLVLAHRQGRALASPPAGVDSEAPLVFAVITPRGSETALAAWGPFVHRLGQELGHPMAVRTWTLSDPRALAQAFQSGEIDLAWVGNSAALALVEEGVGEVFAQMVTDSGSTGYQSIIVAHKDSGLSVLDDAQRPGRKLVFADGETKSFSGHLIPMYYAFVKRGINDPAALYAQVRRGSHRDNLVMVAERRVDIATANDEELAMFRARNPELASQLRTIWTSPVIPQSPLVWSTTLPVDLRKRIQQAIVSFGKKSAADQEILRRVNNLSAFRKSRNSQLITAGDIDMFVAWQQVNNSTGLTEAERAARIRAISERASRLELRLKLPPSVP